MAGAATLGSVDGMTDTWTVRTVDGAAVRLRSGSAGIMKIDITAPVSGGELRIDGDSVRLTLRLALDQLRTGNFLTQAAARKIISTYDAHVLAYDGTGRAGPPIRVGGHAVAAEIDVELDLTVTPVGPEGSPLDEIELLGSASLGTVHLPIPGMGTIEDFSFDVDARLALRPSA